MNSGIKTTTVALAVLLCAPLVAALTGTGGEAAPDWEDPAVVGRNKEPGRATCVRFRVLPDE